MATFKYEIFKDRKRIDGTYNVKIRVTHNRKLKRSFPTSRFFCYENKPHQGVQNQKSRDSSCQSVSDQQQSETNVTARPERKLNLKVGNSVV